MGGSIVGQLLGTGEREVALMVDPVESFARKPAERAALYGLGALLRYAAIGLTMVLFFVSMFEALRWTDPLSSGALFTLVPLMAAGFADWLGLDGSFYAFALLNLAGAALVFHCLGQAAAREASGPQPAPLAVWAIHLRNPALQASFAIGCSPGSSIGSMSANTGWQRIWGLLP